MTTRYERFLGSDPPSGTITRFEVVRHELSHDGNSIAITVAINWVAVESLREKRSEPITWLVKIYGRYRDDSTSVLAVADSRVATVQYAQTAAGHEARYEIQIVIELPANAPSPSFEATIRRQEDLFRSPLGDTVGYIENPDLDPIIEKTSQDVGKWLRGEINSFRSPSESMSTGYSSSPQTPSSGPSSEISLTDARLAVYAPSSVERGRQFLLEVWAFNPALHVLVADQATKQGRAQLLGSQGPVPLATGKTLAVSVAIPSFEVDPSMDAAVWDGRIANTSFVVRAAHDTAIGSHVGSATVSSGGVPVAVVRFELIVTDKAVEARRSLADEQTRIRSIFASYASDDRLDVLQWARGAAVAGLDVFLDVLTLREGSAWEKELIRHVPSKDLFCLFWSSAASRSKWVDMEWRFALASRGLDYIHPVPLADPRVVPPPHELSSKHFSDLSFIVREYEKRIGGAPSSPAS
jgi:hypothetical protein